MVYYMYSKHEKVKFIICPYCGYNNEFFRFQNYGTCLRCDNIIDKKVYLKHKLDLANRKIVIREDYNEYYINK